MKSGTVKPTVPKGIWTAKLPPKRLTASKPVISKAPLIRILVPFVLGILLSELIDASAATIAVAVAVTMAVYAASEFFIHKTPARAIGLAFIPTWLLMLLCLEVGMATEYIDRTRDFDTRRLEGEMVWGRITDIRDMGNSTELRISMLGCLNDSTASISGKRITASLNYKDFMLSEGDIIAFRAKLSPISNYGNPEEFDYRQYMRQQGYLYGTLLTEYSFRVIGHSDDMTTRAKHMKRHLTNSVVNSSLAPRTKYLINTAILGDTSFVDSSTRLIFSEAGIAHILAISGLHIGIIIMLITMLLRPLDYIHARWLRIAVSLAASAFVVFVTGASPSATRAALMAAFLMAALLAHRENSSLNALCAAAITILLFSPASIHNVGFQLSFAAVLMIILLFDKLCRISPRRHTAFFIASSLLAIALANVGCAIISAHYFHTVPMLSLLTNLIIIPLLSFFIGIGIPFIAFSAFGVDVHEVGWVLDLLSSWTHGIAEFSSSLPLSHLENVHISTTMLVLYFITVVLMTAYIYQKNFYLLIGSLTFVAAAVFVSAIELAYTPQQGAVIFCDYRSTPVMYFSHGTGYVWCEDDGDFDCSDLSRRHINMLAKYRIDSVYSTGTHPLPCISPPVASLCGKRIAVITANKWKYASIRSKFIQVDYLVVTKQYYGKIADLLRTFSPKVIVLSGNIYPDKRAEYAEQCASLGIACHDIRTSGAIFIK